MVYRTYLSVYSMCVCVSVLAVKRPKCIDRSVTATTVTRQPHENIQIEREMGENEKEIMRLHKMQFGTHSHILYTMCAISSPVACRSFCSLRETLTRSHHWTALRLFHLNVITCSSILSLTMFCWMCSTWRQNRRAGGTNKREPIVFFRFLAFTPAVNCT